MTQTTKKSQQSSGIELIEEGNTCALIAPTTPSNIAPLDIVVPAGNNHSHNHTCHNHQDDDGGDCENPDDCAAYDVASTLDDEEESGSSCSIQETEGATTSDDDEDDFSSSCDEHLPRVVNSSAESSEVNNNNIASSSAARMTNCRSDSELNAASENEMLRRQVQQLQEDLARLQPQQQQQSSSPPSRSRNPKRIQRRSSLRSSDSTGTQSKLPKKALRTSTTPNKRPSTNRKTAVEMEDLEQQQQQQQHVSSPGLHHRHSNHYSSSSPCQNIFRNTTTCTVTEDIENIASCDTHDDDDDQEAIRLLKKGKTTDSTGTGTTTTGSSSGCSSSSLDMNETDLEPGVNLELPFWESLKDRGGWLVGLLVLQSMSSFIISRNENLLQEHIVIVQFLTMLVGAGGNAGNQASVRVIRGLAVGTVNDANVKEYLKDELKMGVTMATVLGVAGCIRAAVFLIPMRETIAITASLWLIVFLSIVLGSLLPLAMKHASIDPAHSSTTIQVLMDILGVTITVQVCSMILGGPSSAIPSLAGG